MEIFVLEKIEMERSKITQMRIERLEDHLNNLRNVCTELYKLHSYYLEDLNRENKVKWDEAREYLFKIEKSSWNEEKDTLNLYKAQAFFYLGTAYKEQGDYDEALNKLNTARKLIEELSAESIVPECYVRTCMGLAKCYMEKHSSASMIKDCYRCAGQIIDGIEDDNKRLKLFKLELLLQKAIAAMDMYAAGESDIEGNKVNDCKYDYIQEAWLLIEDAKSVRDELFSGGMIDVLDENWKKKMDKTLITTKANYYKKLYFKLSDTDLYQETDSVLDGENLQSSFENAFKLFARVIDKDPKNTIAINSIAALLYDHYQKTEDKEYLSSLLSQNFGENNIFIRSSIPEVIDAFLDQTLMVEYNNMFALNMKAALNGNKREMSTIEHYQMLRQSALKNRFKNLKKIIGDICPDELRDIMVNLIILHSKASEFMDSAIIDFTDPQWKDLKVGHYTRLKVLPQLINRDPNSRMRIQNVHHLNDPLEGVLFVDLLRKRFDGKENGQESVIENLLALYGSEKNGTVRNSVYMGSFTSRLDQLNMWSRYGDGGRGCSLQLDAAQSFDKRAKISLEGLFTDKDDFSYTMDDTKYPLYMVLYLPREDTEKLGEIEKYARSRADTSKQERIWWEKQADMTVKLAKLMGQVEHTIDKINSDFAQISRMLNGDLRRNARGELCNTIMLILDLVRFLIKSDCYRDEREYRIIQYSSDPEYYMEDKMPKLYIPVKKKLVYEKICFGPLVQNFDSQAAYVLNIKKEKIDGEPKKTWNLEVCKSDIDYR